MNFNRKIRLIETFAGVGCQAQALKNIGVEFEHYKVIEFDKYPLAMYNAIHGTEFPTMDITQTHADDLEIVDQDKYLYLLTYSFPCQDISVAGHQKGYDKGSGTRSGLLWEVERILNECIEDDRYGLPDILVMENVTQVHGTKNRENFDKWLDFLKSIGYESKWQDCNAKNYGVAQNRDRCFCVSYLGENDYEFPEPIQLTTCMADYLDDVVPDKYYINNERSDKLINDLISNGTLDEVDVAYTQHGM